MKVFEGIVTSAKLNKTVTVKVARYFLHPLYKKRIKLTKKFLCHDEIGVREGETVSIQECRPLSAHKHFIVLKMIKGATEATKSGIGMKEEVEKVKKEEKIVEKKDRKQVEEKPAETTLMEKKSVPTKKKSIKTAKPVKAKPAKVTKKN